MEEENKIKVVELDSGLRYVKTESLLKDAKSIIDAADTQVRRSVNVTLVARNWLLGKRIDEEILWYGGRFRVPPDGGPESETPGYCTVG